ncbi:hypothetical protein H1R20_g6956, partial [Candolleomyces eurysporus]
MTQCAPPPPCDLDEEYYWDFVTFSARGRLFRVPKYRLTNESEYFASKYGLDGDSGSEHEYGTVEDPRLNAVKLDDVSADEFRSFLKAVYPKVMHSYLTLAKDDWLSVLKLSTRWLFNDFRKKAIEELSWLNLDPIERIQLGKEFDVEAWLQSGCRDLVSRETVISIEDAEKINWQVAISLYIIRDGVKKDAMADAIDDQVRNAFSTDFERIKGSQSLYLSAEERLREVQEEEERKREAEERKKEEEELAIREAESRRLEALAAEEEKRVAELALELENRRQKLRSIGATHTMPSPITPRESEIAESKNDAQEREPMDPEPEAPAVPKIPSFRWPSPPIPIPGPAVNRRESNGFGWGGWGAPQASGLSVGGLDSPRMAEPDEDPKSYIPDTPVEGLAKKKKKSRKNVSELEQPALADAVEDVERQHLPAQEEDDQEEDRSTGETHLRVEEDSGQRQEEAPLQKALAEVLKSLEEHKVAFEKSRKALQPIDATRPSVVQPRA